MSSMTLEHSSGQTVAGEHIHHESEYSKIGSITRAEFDDLSATLNRVEAEARRAGEVHILEDCAKARTRLVELLENPYSPVVIIRVLFRFFHHHAAGLMKQAKSNERVRVS